MQRKTDKKNVYNSGKNPSNQDLVFQHMSSHYRRILNAKKAVDTSPPYCFKARRASGVNSSARAANKGTKPFISRHASPALTDRSLSTNSYKESCWGTESVVGSSRYHAECTQETEPFAPIKYTCIDMDLIDRITFDTKNGPAAYCDEGWMEIKAQHNDKLYKSRHNVKEGKSEPIPALKPKRRLPEKEKESKQKRKFSIQGKTSSTDSTGDLKPYLTPNKIKYNSRDVKTEAVSKLKSLRVYHPPRRKERIPVDKQSEIPIESSLETPKCKCANICVCDPNENESEFKKTLENPKEGQTSSRDSAYNGGISSLPESRSPTPDHRRKKECTCGAQDGSVYCDQSENVCRKQKETKEVNFREELSAEENELISLGVSPRTKLMPFNEDSKESLRQLKEDALYIKFIQDITVEILEKNFYTNKALKKVMKRHVIQNLNVLNKERMLKEVENLRIKLGIPEDKDLFNLDLEPVQSCTSLADPHPTISDSQFVLSKDLEHKIQNDHANKVNAENTDDEKLVESISEVLEKRERCEANDYNSESEKDGSENYSGTNYDDDDDEIISVIQVTKALRAKNKGKGAESLEKERRRDSADESDQSVHYKRRTRKLSMKQEVTFRKHMESSSSSSDNEENRKRRSALVDGNKETQEDRNSTMKNEYFLESKNSARLFSSSYDKKARSVSFRNSKDFKMCETNEIKTKKTFVSGKKT